MTDALATSSDAERVRHAVLAVDGVADLHGGAFGEVATYLPGGRVAGVRVDRSAIDVHIVVYLESDIRHVAENVRAAAQAVFADSRPCTVVVEDVAAGPSSAQSLPTGVISSQESKES